jgi:hypothetical protein
MFGVVFTGAAVSIRISLGLDEAKLTPCVIQMNSARAFGPDVVSFISIQLFNLFFSLLTTT